jgi:hypothetical protein
MEKLTQIGNKMNASVQIARGDYAMQSANSNVWVTADGPAAERSSENMSGADGPMVAVLGSETLERRDP